MSEDDLQKFKDELQDELRYDLGAAIAGLQTESKAQNKPVQLNYVRTQASREQVEEWQQRLESLAREIDSHRDVCGDVPFSLVTGYAAV